MDTTKWTTLVDPRFDLTVRYPAVTPDGHQVERTNEHEETSITVRLTADTKRALYVEITRFPDATVESLYAAICTLSTRNPAALSVGILQETTLGTHQAHTFFLRRDALERTVLLIQRGSDAYRITYDSTSVLSEQVFSTITFAA